MLLIDNIFIAIVLVSALVGAYRGFFPEAISLLTWGVAVWVAWQYSPLLEAQLLTHIESPVLTVWISRFIIFASLLIIGGLINEMLSLLIEKSGLTGTDRVLGLVFGFARGVLIMGVVVIFAKMLGVEKEAWWDESRMIPVGEKVADLISDVLPAEILEHLQAEPEEFDPQLPESSLPESPIPLGE